MLENVIEIVDVKNECANRTTTVEIVSKITGEIFTGVAKCHPPDTYNSFVGFDITFKRAVCNMLCTVLYDYAHGIDYMAEFLFKLNK